MASDAHIRYVQAVRELEDTFGDLEITDFTLTDEEAEALESLPESVVEMHSELLSRYKPLSEDTDFRDAGWRKFMGVVLTKGLPIFKRAYDTGRSAGRG